MTDNINKLDTELPEIVFIFNFILYEERWHFVIPFEFFFICCRCSKKKKRIFVCVYQSIYYTLDIHMYYINKRKSSFTIKAWNQFSDYVYLTYIIFYISYHIYNIIIFVFYVEWSTMYHKTLLRYINYIDHSLSIHFFSLYLYKYKIFIQKIKHRYQVSWSSM